MANPGLRICVACDDPSPGPAKRLFYQPRTHGPFFPVLEERRTSENSTLFIGGRTVVCMSCASHLQRQWTNHEKKWTPLERRTYKLLSTERLERHQGRSSKLSSISQEEQEMEPREKPSTKWKKTITKVNSQQKFVNALGASDYSAVRTPQLGESTRTHRQVKLVSESNGALGKFRNAARNVHDVNGRRPTPRLHTVAERLQELEMSESEEGQPIGGTPIEEADAENHGACAKVPERQIEERVERKLKESAEILIKKIAEIQYEENLRHSQETIRSTLERVSTTQDRGRFVKSVEKKLRARLHQDLQFRSVAEPLTAPVPPSQALVPVDHVKRHREILEELSREREWREKADAAMKEQEQKIEHLRKSLHEEIKHVIQMQTKQFEEVKRLIDRSHHVNRRSPSDQAYVSLDAVSTQSSSNREGREAKRRTEPRKARRSEDWESGERRSRSSTPGFYIQ